MSNINFKNKQFNSVLPVARLNKSTDFIIGDSVFPKPVSGIIKTGKNIVSKPDKELK